MSRKKIINSKSTPMFIETPCKSKIKLENKEYRNYL